MIPKFLRPEVFPTPWTLEGELARLTDTAPPRSTTAYRLHVRDVRGVETSQTFTTALTRSLALIALTKQPVDLRIEDVAVERDDDDDDDDRDEQYGAQCSPGCGFCGRCS
jgi:hypothetical protein